MNLRDAETGKVLWQGTEDLSVPGVEHEGKQVSHMFLWMFVSAIHLSTFFFQLLYEDIIT